MRKHYLKDNFIWLSLLLLLMIILGCDHLIKPTVPPPIDDIKKTDRLSLDRGYKVFINDDIERAAAIFNALIQSKDRDISNNARFAFICSQLILSKNNRTTQVAKTEMAKLLNRGALKLDNNNLIILNNLLEHLKRQLKAAKSKKPSLDERCANHYREILKLKEEKIEELNIINTDLKEEVSSLKNKIKSIEEIDQKIEEKKNPDKHRKKF